MPGALETNLHLPYRHRASVAAVHRLAASGTSIGSAAVIRLYLLRRSATLELRDEYQAEADVVVAVGGVVAVAIRRTAVLRVVVPATAAQHPVRTHDGCPFGAICLP